MNPKAAARTRVWNAVLVAVSAGNLVAVWFAAQPGEPAWHATIHAGLALGFGLWAQRRISLGAARMRSEEDPASESEIVALGNEVLEARREMGELQERVDFAEQMLSKARHEDRTPR